MKTFTRLFIIPIMLVASASQAQYCMLPGRTPYSTDQPGITNFKLNTINRTSSNVESMTTVVKVTTDSTVLLRGHTYTVSITHSKDVFNFPTARNNIRVWIDYNNNYSFNDAGETVVTSDFDTPGVFTANFTVPMTAPLGTFRLRATVKMSSDAGHITPTSCDTLPMDAIGYHGEIEDYKVRIIPTTEIEEINAAARPVEVYPNPISDQFTIAFDAINEEPMSVDMYDMSGKLIGHLLNEPVQTSLAYNFSLNNYTTARGMYLVKVVSGGFTSYQKVVKAD
jgi:GEVED domain/Secretion system C-terminal sorting domain